jgi:hypothetical protein
LACCGVAIAQAARAQETVPWRVVCAAAYVSASTSGGDSGYVYCDGDSDSSGDFACDPAGLQFGVGAVVDLYRYCCIDRSSGCYYCCEGYSEAAYAWMEIAPDHVRIQSDCWAYSCNFFFRFEVVFDRPMRVTTDTGYIGHPSCGATSCEFTGAGIIEGNHIQASYELFPGGGYSAGQTLRFERMFPADIVPDRIVNGVDLSAILSKWGGPYDPQRTPEDVNLDGQVNAEDLAAVLFAWGTPG